MTNDNSPSTKNAVLSIDTSENVSTVETSETVENKVIDNMNDDDINKIVIVNLSNNDDDNTNIPTPTITTSKAFFDDDVVSPDKKQDNAVGNLSPSTPSSVDINVSLNEISTESVGIIETTTEKTIENEASKESLIENQGIPEENQEIPEDNSDKASDSSLSDVDLDKMIAENLNTDFMEVDLNSSTKDVPIASGYSGVMDACAASLIDDDSRPVLLEQIIDSVNDEEVAPIMIGNTTADIINSSLMKLNLNEENTMDENEVAKIRDNFGIQNIDNESDNESDDSNDSINIKIIISSPENEQIELLSYNNIKIVVTDPDNVKQTIYPYQESGVKEAINKAIDKRVYRSKN